MKKTLISITIIAVILVIFTVHSKGNQNRFAQLCSNDLVGTNVENAKTRFKGFIYSEISEQNTMTFFYKKNESRGFGPRCFLDFDSEKIIKEVKFDLAD